MTLKEKKIGPGATLHLVLRLRGDGGGDSRAALHEEASCGDSTGFAGGTHVCVYWER